MPSSLAAMLNGSADTPVKLERTLLKAQVADLLRNRIIRGQIQPGTLLVEREIATTLNISRLPVREALQELEKEGLVVSTATNRRTVIELTERDIRELYEVRLCLETLAVERAAQVTSPANRAELLDTLEQMERAYRDHNDLAFPRTDVNLHHVIWRQADNMHLQGVLLSMMSRLMMFTSLHSQMFNWDEVLPLHRDLVDCINTGDPRAAHASIERHMQNSLDRSLRAFSKQ